MTDRIANVFIKLRDVNRAALVPFVMGGDPDLKTTAALLKALAESGADIIEIGMPFSDPMADGPVIQAAGRRALKSGTTIAGILKIVGEFRKHDKKTPIILMGYYNPIYRFGDENFCKQAARAGVDGVIIVDLPPEEERDIRPYLTKYKLKLIRLVSPTSDAARLPLLLESASGYLYYIAITGITGTKSADMEGLEDQVQYVRDFTDLPIAVGFGIKTVAQVQQVAQFADAAVVGSALISTLAKKKNAKDAARAAERFVISLIDGLWG